jgi:Protein of unknown function (DUF2786)
MSRRAEKVRKLRALARDKSAFANEAAVALAKAQALESKTAKTIAHAIAQLLEKRGLVARVRRRHRRHDDGHVGKEIDADVGYLSYRDYNMRGFSPLQLEILVIGYE